MPCIEISAQNLIKLFSTAASVTQHHWCSSVAYASVTQSTELSHREQRQNIKTGLKFVKVKLTEHFLQSLTVNYFSGQFLLIDHLRVLHNCAENHADPNVLSRKKIPILHALFFGLKNSLNLPYFGPFCIMPCPKSPVYLMLPPASCLCLYLSSIARSETLEE